MYSEKHISYSEGMSRAKHNLRPFSNFVGEYEGSEDCYGRAMPTSVAEVEMHTHKRMPYEVELNAHSVGIEATAQVMRVTGLR